MKDQNKYAQLVEAQPREQQDLSISQTNRKISQSSSQISMTIMSTGSSSRRSSSITGSVMYNPSSNGSRTIIKTKMNTTNLNRTISKSMLDLDKSCRSNKFTVTWNNLTFCYKPSWFNKTFKKPTKVLCDLSGSFRSNQLVALIGPSGCGKTTLLQFLAGNIEVHREKMRINGLDEPKVAYIGQDDCLLPGLTSKETLIYASRLQNNDPNFDHEQHILPILTQLGLTDCADRSVTKLSGGQAKRVIIAQQLLYPTNILILDEVTSGLDASTSYSIVKLLKNLVSDTNYPMSIIISIHQPSAKLFSVFDKVYAMANGYCLYEGSCDTDLINLHIKRFGLECPKYTNVADYLIEIATNNDLSVDSKIREEMIQYQLKTNAFEADISDEAKTNGHIEMPDANKQIYCFKDSNSSLAYGSQEDSCDENLSESQKVSILTQSSSLYDGIARARDKRLRPFCSQFIIHLNRSFLRIRRSYILTYLQLMTYILLGLQLATFYGPTIGSLSGCPKLPSSLISMVLSHDEEVADGSATNEMRRIQENMNFLLVSVMTATFAALEITVITFPLEAKTIKREWRNGWYRVSSYFMGRSMADLPFQLTFVILFCTCIYILTGQPGILTWRFGYFIAIVVMIALVAQAIGFTFGALFMNNLPAAVFTAPLCIFPTLLFSGFFSRVAQIPAIYKPMTYLSHFRYAFDGLLVTLYGYDRCECDQEILSSYHSNMKNQSSTVREMIKILFGNSDCVTQDPRENNLEDITTSPMEIGIMNLTTTTEGPLRTTRFKSLEDALVDSVFEHMSSKSSDLNQSDSDIGGSTMDHLATKFSSKITNMLNKQSNYGHDVPRECRDFNSYLMTEFGLRNEDLLVSILALVVAVVLTRLLSNLILSLTIANRA